MSPNLPVFVLLFGSILWGLSWIPLKYFKESGIEGIPLVLMGYGTVAILLLPVFIRQYPRWREQQKYIWIILCFSGIANLTFTSAIMYGDVIRVMVLFYLIPAWGVLGGWYFLKEKIDTVRSIAVVFALAGAFLVLGGPKIFNTAANWLDLLAIIAGFSLAMNNIAFRASSNLPIGSKMAAIFIGSLVFSILLTFAGVQNIPNAPILLWTTVILFVLSWIFIATLATQWAVTKMDVGRASILIIMELITAVISAMWIGDERLNESEIVGGLLIFCSAILEARRPSLITP
ncbi:MAG TPA: DMT family transporter [Gammaproteobacteria bacterium]|nr:DMT family transporter [Gammaproteobacteria bacterium]